MIYRFGELFNIIDGDRGKNYPKDDDFFDDEYCLFLNAGNVTKEGWSFENNSFITVEKDNQLRKGKVERGNTVLTTRGTVGNAAYYGDRVKYEHMRINSGMVILTPKDTNIVEDEFIYYLVISPIAKRTIELFCSGSAQPQLPIKDFIKIKYDLPDLDKQKEIVNILSTYDALIELNTKRIKTLEQMAENLYKEWFVRFRFPGHENAEFENGIPKGWEIKRLYTIADIVMGQSPESSLYNMEKQGLPFHQGVGSYGEYYLKDEVYSTGGNKIANPNSIIFSVRAPVGRINITLNTIILGRGVASINSKTDNNGFLYWLLKFKFHQEDLIGNGSIFSSVTKKELDNQKFVIPPYDIIQRFDDFAKLIEKNMRVLYLNNENLIKQRDLLLPRLMSGKLEV